MRTKIIQTRINSARDTAAKLLDDHHHDRIGGEDLDIVLGQVRNQLDIILDDLGECDEN